MPQTGNVASPATVRDDMQPDCVTLCGKAFTHRAIGARTLLQRSDLSNAVIHSRHIKH